MNQVNQVNGIAPCPDAVGQGCRTSGRTQGASEVWVAGEGRLVCQAAEVGVPAT